MSMAGSAGLRSDRPSPDEGGPAASTQLRQVFSRLQAGERGAVTVLVRNWGDRLYRTALGVVRSREAAEDVVQETFLKAITRAGSFEGRSDPGTWLYRVCVNTAYDHLRREKRYSVEARACAGPGNGPEVDEASREAEELIELRAAVDALPPQLRATLILHYVEDLSVRDVARVTRVAPGTVKARLHRARQILKVQINEGGTRS
jgi:RNA polymerase sigma-70 factor (ECF subfamily)